MIFDKNGQASINRKEMRAIKQMDHRQLEEVLTNAYEIGLHRAAEENKESEKIIKTCEVALCETLNNFKGIGDKRKDIFLLMYKERLKVGLGE